MYINIYTTVTLDRLKSHLVIPYSRKIQYSTESQLTSSSILPSVVRPRSTRPVSGEPQHPAAVGSLEPVAFLGENGHVGWFGYWKWWLCSSQTVKLDEIGQHHWTCSFAVWEVMILMVVILEITSGSSGSSMFIDWSVWAEFRRAMANAQLRFTPCSQWRSTHPSGATGKDWCQQNHAKSPS